MSASVASYRTRVPPNEDGPPIGRRPRSPGGPTSTPTELASAAAAGRVLEDWFATEGREFPWREWTDSYRLVVVEILLQRTRAPVVAPFCGQFFREYPDWHALAMANPDELERRLAPLGLQHRRAATLLDLAGRVEEGHELGGDMPGIGQYVDRAVRVALHGERVAMLDANFVRVLKRVFGGSWMSDYRYDRRLQQLGQALVDGAEDPRAVNWAVLDLGATVCMPSRPDCASCPLRADCLHAAGAASCS